MDVSLLSHGWDSWLHSCHGMHFRLWYVFPVIRYPVKKPRERLADIDQFIVDRHYPRRPGHDPAAGRKLEYRCSPSHVRIPGNQTQ